MRNLFFAAGLMALAVPASAQEEKISTYETLDNFIASSAAYDKCGSNDEALKFRFSANLKAVSARAALQAKEDHPYDPEGDLVNAMKERGKAIKAKVAEEAEKLGCASEPVKQLLKLYELSANLNMLAGDGK